MRLPLPFCLPFFLILSIGIQAQSDARTTYEKKSIGFYGSNFIRDGEKLSFKQLALYLNSYPETAIEYNIARKNRNAGIILSVGVLICTTIGFTQLYKYDDDAALGFFIGGACLSLVAIPLGNKSLKKTQHAVWLYNRNILPN